MDELDPRYRRILEECRPFLVAHRGSLPYLDLAPLGAAIEPDLLLDPTSLRSRAFIDGLHALDGASFGPLEMRMPRWVLFDCGELPGVVVGFARRAGDLPRRARDLYEAPPEALVPLSMWVAIACAEPGAWLGHNLSSINLVLGDEGMPGLATLTKALGIRVTRAKAQLGATQWTSPSLGIHLTFGEMRLLSAWTPAHTHEGSLSYRIDIDNERIAASLKAGFQRPVALADRLIDPRDHAALLALQGEIEAGAEYAIIDVDADVDAEAGRVHLRKTGDKPSSCQEVIS
jgi:hypothetical protein